MKSLSLGLAILAVLLAAAVAADNYLSLQSQMDAVLKGDPRNSGLDVSDRIRLSLEGLDMIADQQPCNLMIRCSDDDYQTWSNWRTVSLTQPRAFLQNCGTFAKRAYHLRHQADTTFRIMALESTFDIGTL